MHAALVIAAKDLRQRLRDRSAIVLGFVAPLLIAALMSFAFQGTESFHVTLALADSDHGPVAGAFSGVLGSQELRDVVTVKPVADASAAAAAVTSGNAQAAIVIPPGFSAGATGDVPVAVDVLTSVDHSLAGQLARVLADSVIAQINADRLSVATAVAAGASLDQIATLVADAAGQHLPVDALQRPTGARDLKAISYFAPAMGIFFVFFAISFSARGYFLEVREGTLERMSAAVRPAEILVGKSLSVFVYGLLSLATMAVFTTALFGADWGGLVPAAALCIAMVTAVVALTMFVILIARTERQAEGFSSIVVFTLALLGGNFVFVSSAPPLLRQLALLTPNGWALRGFVDLATSDRSLATIAEPVAAIFGFSFVMLAVAALLSRRMVRV